MFRMCPVCYPDIFSDVKRSSNMCEDVIFLQLIQKTINYLLFVASTDKIPEHFLFSFSLFFFAFLKRSY